MLDTAAIWAALLKDPTFAQQIPPGKPQEVFRHELVDELPKILGGLVEQRVDFKTLIAAKVAVLKYTIDASVMQHLIAAFPGELLEQIGATADRLIEMLEEALPGMLEQITQIGDRIPEMLQEVGMTEGEALAHPKMGKLNRESMRLLRANKLTVGKLLEIQPFVILKNTD